MAEDMVASLTLRLQNQLSGGLDEIKQQFNALSGTLDALNGTMGELRDLMAALRGPLQLETDLKAVQDQAAETAATIKSMQTGLQVPTVVPGGQPADRSPGSPGPDDDRIKHPDKNIPNMLESGSVGDYIALFSGYEGAEYDARLQTLLNNITNTEKIHGAAADAEQIRIGDMMHALADKYNSDSGALLAAYNYLITTGIKPGEVDALMPGLAEAGTAHAIDPTDMTKAVMALAESYKIDAADMGVVLGQMGYATKMGHFNADSFSAFLPMIGGALAAVGVSGDDAADYTFAAMESIIKNVSIPAEAATDYTDFIHYIGTQHAERSFLQKSRMMLPQMRAIFSKYHIGDADMWGMENAALAKGEDPVETILDFVHTATANMSPVDRNAVISDYFTNQEGGDAVRALMQYWNSTTNPDGSVTPGFQANYKELKTVDQTTLDEDFHQAAQGAAADMRGFGESLNQLNEVMGKMFLGLVAEPVHAVVSGNIFSGGPANVGLGPMHPNTAPVIHLHVNVDKSGNVTAKAGRSPVPSGQVLGRH